MKWKTIIQIDQRLTVVFKLQEMVKMKFPKFQRAAWIIESEGFLELDETPNDMKVKKAGTGQDDKAYEQDSG